LPIGDPLEQSLPVGKPHNLLYGMGTCQIVVDFMKEEIVMNTFKDLILEMYMGFSKLVTPATNED